MLKSNDPIAVKEMAIDVLNRIDEGSIAPLTQTYLNPPIEHNGKKVCQACALGSCMLSLAGANIEDESNSEFFKAYPNGDLTVKDYFTFGSIREKPIWASVDTFTGVGYRERLIEVLGPEIAGVLESLFEGNLLHLGKNYENDDEFDANWSEGCREKLGDLANHFVRVYSRPKDRLILLMKNIVNNDGNFAVEEIEQLLEGSNV